MIAMTGTTGRKAPNASRVRVENERYLREQLITYLGNKRGLLHTIDAALARVRRRLGRDRLRILDAFAGSGVVSRLFKQHASLLVSNDLEPYAKIIGECYLANASEIDFTELRRHHARVEGAARSLPVRDGFIRRLYSPERDDAIQPGERVFFTVDNAMRIDSMRAAIREAPAAMQSFLLAPLLAEASVHNNTSGVFKGFYKDARGIGRFGGQNGDALARILGRIELPFPVFSRFECDVQVHREDANQLVRRLPAMDVAYFDPPYNQHPYGSNYFMLNLIATYEEPAVISAVSGIVQGWQRSEYNRRGAAAHALEDLIVHTPASHLLISYNNEGFISRAQFDALLSRHGRVEVIETVYNTFRGSRNLRNRPLHVKEQLFLVERA
ncbi:MAG: restriction endonuclease subunit M [Phycisphaerae bacterium]|nr:MAG: restriction endonuclease subunit M [Phycisphaerae bacterium]